MVHKCRSENSLVESSPRASKQKGKRQKSEDFKKHISKMDSIVRSLESSILQSNDHDRQLLMTIRRDNVRNQRLSHQLEEARKENSQLLCSFQTGNGEADVSRTTSRSQLDHSSSYSTISMVHLQYKYEELLSSHEGLLKVLESKIKESQKCYHENEELRDELQKQFLQISDNEKTIKALCDKYLKLKQRKDSKIRSLRYERDTLRLAHNKVVGLLHQKCMADDHVLCGELQKSGEPTRSLLLKEVKLCNKLQHENSKLQQENEILKCRIKLMAERKFGNNRKSKLNKK